MNLFDVPAYGAQLAQLLAEVMKLAGHLKTPPKDLRELIAAAQRVIAADARVDHPVVLDAALTDGHAQRVWIVTDDAGVDVMMCPKKPDATAIENIEAKIGHKVEVEEFFLTPTKLAQLVDRGLMAPLPNHNPNDPRRNVYSADEVRQAQAEAVALDRSVHPRVTHAPTPVFVVEMQGGTILKTSGTQAAHVFFIDTDTEGSDDDQVVRMLGEDYHVTQHQADVSPASAILVDQVLEAVTAAAEAAEAALPLPRYVVGLNWKQFLPDMDEEQTMRFVFDTQTREILAMQLETDNGHVLATSAATAHVLEGLFDCQEALANPYSYGLEYVEEIPTWAEPAASLALPDPVVFFALRNHDGPPHYTTKAVQDHAIAYVQVDRLAAGREYQHPPSINDLPNLPAPEFPGMPERGVDGHFSKAQLLAYRELAAEVERDDYAHALMDAAEEEAEAPRG